MIINFCANTNHLLIPTDINDLGVVIGKFYKGQEMGFLWTPSFGIQYLEGFSPQAINNLGIIVGSKASSEIAVMWNKGKLIDLSEETRVDEKISLGINRLTSITDINDLNQMVGLGRTSKNALQCVVISPIN